MDAFDCYLSTRVAERRARQRAMWRSFCAALLEVWPVLLIAILIASEVSHG